MCERTVYNFIHWKNRVRTTTFGFGFCSVLYRVGGFGSGSCTFFTFRFSFVLDKTRVLVRFVLAGFGFFPISSHGSSSQYSLAKGLVPAKGWCCMVGKDILRVANSTRDCRRALDLRSTPGHLVLRASRSHIHACFGHQAVQFGTGQITADVQ